MKLLVPNIGLVFWTLLVFPVLFIWLKKWAWRPILQAVKEREAGIAAALAEAQKMKAELAQLKSENERFWAQARHEREQMIREAKETAIQLRWEAREKARKEVRLFVEEAFAAIEQQKRTALEQAKQQVREIAMEASEKLLRRSLSDKGATEVYVNEWLTPKT